MAKKRTGTLRSADSVLGVPSLELVTGVLERIPGTHSFAAAYYIRLGEYQRAAELRADPRDYTNHEEFALELLGYSLLRKYPGFPGSSDRAGLAIEKWLECEEQCQITNERIKAFRLGRERSDLHEAFRLARKKIEKLLGEFRWSKVARHFDFGPGSTTRLPFSKRHLPYKYGESPETTFDNLASTQAILGLSPVWLRATQGRDTDGVLPHVKLREESKVTTVPKDAFIDRVIAIEPDMNMFVQKGFGGYIRRRLKWVGINLDDQTLNQSLARSASRGGLATIDLKSASDSISFELIRELLPPDWFEALLSCRTHASRLPSGEIISLQKFSAMGNGFTFELESLIFWALCSAVCSETIGREGLRAAVYGDDIIVTVKDFPAVVDILEFCGFATNPKKTYADGPYRESCGKHYFYGHDVTPITITKEVSNVSQLLLLSNNLVRFALRLGVGGWCRHASVFEAYRWSIRHLPPQFQRPRIPDGYGDGALIGSFAECRPARCRRGWDGWRVGHILLSKQSVRFSSGVPTLAACLSRLERRTHVLQSRGSGLLPIHGSLQGVSQRRKRGGYPEGSPHDLELLAGGHVASGANKHLVASSPAEIPVSYRYRLGKVFVKQWCEMGPWV